MTGTGVDHTPVLLYSGTLQAVSASATELFVYGEHSREERELFIHYTNTSYDIYSYVLIRLGIDKERCS